MFDAVTYGAAVGAAKRYTDEHSGSDDAVKYTEQSLTSEQQAQARENIGAAASTDIPTDAVKYTAQTLTDAQKTQARTNIGVVQPDWRQSNSSGTDYIKNKPPILAVYPGTSGSFTGGTGMNNMNEATKQNSIAYGYAVSAKGNYSAAFGYFLQALHDYEIAYGKFNQSNADTAFSIGDGTSNSDKHNLMELKTNGTLLLNGNAVKTEDATDNKLRLGQICGMKFSSSTIGRHIFGEGFGSLFGSIDSITFTSDTSADVVASSTVYQFGDFVGYIDSNAVIVRPIRGKLDYPTMEQWIKIENCYDMFANCIVITSLDLSSFDTSEVENMTYMFYRCTALTNLDISSFDMTNVVAYDKMFGETSYWAGITTLKCPKINPHDDIPLPRMLYSQDGTAYTNLPVTTGTSIELRAIFITKQPEDVTVEAGTKFTMSVEAIGEGLTYQWQYMRPTETTWNDFTEATSNTLNRTATINWDGWTVHCVITDTNSRTAISDEATITIAPSDGQKYIPDDEKQGEPIDDESKTLKNINGSFTWVDDMQ